MNTILIILGVVLVLAVALYLGMKSGKIKDKLRHAKKMETPMRQYTGAQLRWLGSAPLPLAPTLRPPRSPGETLGFL